ncbi:MAG: hypothetical protein OEX19_17700 [Gammaproteobacteria bacterium]|nr:hypothetical protein [Gammaproteobacteria bacterium]
MFEHKNLDGTWNSVVSSGQSFLSSEVLELKESVAKEADASSRKQYAVVGDRLVERNLPPQKVGDRWSFDAVDEPWWTSVNNPPHAGIVASFNSFCGGLHRKTLDKSNFVIGFASEGEEVLLVDDIYKVIRKKDNTEVTGKDLPELRKNYCMG